MSISKDTHILTQAYLLHSPTIHHFCENLPSIPAEFIQIKSGKAKTSLPLQLLIHRRDQKRRCAFSENRIEILSDKY